MSSLAELVAWEKHLKEEIGKLKLLGELKFDQAWLNWLGEIIGKLMHQKRFDLLRQEYPCCLASYLVFCGIYRYKEGDYWSGVEENLGKLTPNLQQKLGQQFKEFLDQRNLPTFSEEIEEENALPYVTEILLHGGIPNYCLPDFFQNFLDFAILKDDWNYLETEDLILEWFSSSKPLATDKPVIYFLKYGSEFDQAFIAECLKMARAFNEKGSLPSTLKLPVRITEKYQEWTKKREAILFGGQEVNLFTRNGQPSLYSERLPGIFIPSNSQANPDFSELKAWQITINGNSVQFGDEVTHWKSRFCASLHSPNLLDSNHFGQFEIKLRGPLGQSSHHLLNVVPKLKITGHESVRIPRRNGDLPQARLEIETIETALASSDTALKIIEEPAGFYRITVPADRSEVAFTLREAGKQVAFNVPLPALHWGLVESEKETPVPKDNYKPPIQSREWFERKSYLYLKVWLTPDLSCLDIDRQAISLLVHYYHEEEPQVLKGRRFAKKDMIFNLREAADSVRASCQSTILFELVIDNLPGLSAPSYQTVLVLSKASEEVANDQAKVEDEEIGEATDSGATVEVEEIGEATDSSAEVAFYALGDSSDLFLTDHFRWYLHQIGQIPLLKPKEERDLGKAVKKGSEAKRIADQILDFTRNETEKALLHAQIRAGEEARNRLIVANLRLVVSIAKHYRERGLELLDLIQEGNLGLIRAIDKFNFAKWDKISTYATWWIKQAIGRALADQSRLIRLPVHLGEEINRVQAAKRELSQKEGHDPTDKELAQHLAMTEERLRELRHFDQPPISLSTPVGGKADSTLADFIPDPDSLDLDAYNDADNGMLRDQIGEALRHLTEREHNVLALLYGLVDGQTHTLEEVGQHLKVTRERVRQIEYKTLNKLRHPRLSKLLKDYIDPI